MNQARSVRRGHPDFGVLVVDKPAGPTSHELVDWVRWTTRQRAVGHCGTLDPAATGVLVVCLGKATRVASYLTAADKRYTARFCLGASTTTADADGEVTRRMEVDAVQARAVRDALTSMAGMLQLPPPAYSAVKVAGRRAHDLARSGVEVALEARPMELHEISDVRLVAGPEGHELTAQLHVSKGTYVRSLAEELERRTGVFVHLGTLRRTAAGEIDLRQAWGGFRATRIEPASDGEGDGPRRGPKWRVRPPGVDDRAQGGAAVTARLVDPVDVMPFASIDVVGSEIRAIADRLDLGQRVGLADEVARELVERALRGTWARVEHAQEAGAQGASDVSDVAGRFTLAQREAEGQGGRCIVVRVENDPDRGWRLAPEKVVRWTGAQGKSPKLQGPG